MWLTIGFIATGLVSFILGYAAGSAPAASSLCDLDEEGWDMAAGREYRSRHQQSQRDEDKVA